MKFILPLPETTNEAYRSGKKGWYKTEKQKAWEQEAGWEVSRQIKEPIIVITGEVGVILDFYLVRDRDIDNSIKPILDLFQNLGFYLNDKQIRHLLANKWFDEPKRCEVEIYEYRDEAK